MKKKIYRERYNAKITEEVVQQVKDENKPKKKRKSDK